MVKIIKWRVFALSVLGTVKHLDYLKARYSRNRGMCMLKSGISTKIIVYRLKLTSECVANAFFTE